MLSLSTEDVAEHWEQVSPELGQLFASIERAEDWALDNHPDIAERLQSFGLRLSDPAAAAKLADADRNDLLFFLVYISSSKAFRIVQWLDERHAGLGSRLLGVLLQQDSNGVFSNVLDPMLAGTLVQRLQVVQNTPFFQRLLAPEFLGSLSKAITNYHPERSERDE